MKNVKMVAMVMAVLLSVSVFGVSFAEETALPVAEVAFDQAVEVAEATATPEITTSEPTETPVVLEPSAETEATAEPAVTEQPDATETPATETAAPEQTEMVGPVTRSVTINMDVPANLKLGDTVTLTATLIGYDGLNVSLQWQYSNDGENWTDAQNATGLVYAFQVSEQTAGTAWRLAVTVL